MTAAMGPSKCTFINPVAGEEGNFNPGFWVQEWKSTCGMVWMAERIRAAMLRVSPPDVSISAEVRALLNGSPEAFLAAAKDAAQHAPTVPPYAAVLAPTASEGSSAE